MVVSLLEVWFVNTIFNVTGKRLGRRVCAGEKLRDTLLSSNHILVVDDRVG